MRLLLDSHIFIWWLGDERRLDRRLRDLIADPGNLVQVSAASIWELEIEQALGRMILDGEELHPQIAASGFIELPVTARHAVVAARLPRHHGDPFDRMLIGQAMSESLTLVSDDAAIARYDVPLVSPA